MRDGTRRWAARVAPAGAALAVLTGLASAHAVTGNRFDAPLPLSLLYAGAAATVGLTALWLATSERSQPPERGGRVMTVPPHAAEPLRHGARALFLAAAVGVLAAGFFGRQVAAENFATVFTWPVWFRGLALVAVLFGTPWGVLSPWRTVYRGLLRLERGPIAVLGTPLFGAWPAVLGFVALLGVVENLTAVPRSPRLTAVVVAVYAAAMIGGAVLYGPAWFRRGDPLGVLYRLFGRVAPVAVTRTGNGGYAVTIRAPWRDCIDPVAGVPVVVFVVATVYTVTFDGFTNTRGYQTLLFDARGALGTGQQTGALLYVAGLAGFVASFALACWAVERLGRPANRDWVGATRRFAPSVLPIAAGYEVAHNYPYVARNLGQTVAVFGGAPVEPLGWLSVPAFWGSQVALIVAGHVVAVVAAHYAAVARYDALADARRGHLPLVLTMVGYTALSLYVVSQPVVSG